MLLGSICQIHFGQNIMDTRHCEAIRITVAVFCAKQKKETLHLHISSPLARILLAFDGLGSLVLS